MKATFQSHPLLVPHLGSGAYTSTQRLHTLGTQEVLVSWG